MTKNTSKTRVPNTKCERTLRKRQDKQRKEKKRKPNFLLHEFHLLLTTSKEKRDRDQLLEVLPY
jgi:hypothetical protein